MHWNTFFSKMAHKFDDFIIFVKCWCQQKLKLEYLLIGIRYCLAILQTGGPASTLSRKIKIYSTWRIYVMTSSFVEKFKRWWRHQKFRHYGKNKMCNFNNFVVATSLESFISITFIYKEKCIKQIFAIWAMSKRWRGQECVNEFVFFSGYILKKT